MKKIICMILTVAMLLTITAVAESGFAGGNDNDGETGKDGTEKKGKSIVFPIICSGALIALGILTATGKKNHRK